jgi:spore germination protein
MIEAAWENGVKPMLVLTPFANGTFNNQLVKVLAENIEIQQTLIANLLATVQEKGYAGVDVDFEYILPEDRVGYAEFVGRVRETMNVNGYKVSVALAPKTSAGQEGLLYEGMDYALLSANADNVFLMTYEWGYTYSEPMAVAPMRKESQEQD